MKVEILAIGDEILLGQIENTNASWITKKLSSNGIRVGWISVVADDEKEILAAFQRAFRRADVTLITGGLGPTHDDLTKALVAKFFNLPIIFRNDILEDVREGYRKRQLSFIETSREQAEFPEGATPIRNIHGTAPGIWVERDRKIFAAMPGIPLEMRAMLNDFVLPRLIKRSTGEVLLYRTLHTVGVREAFLYEILDNRGEVEQFADLAFLPSYTGVKLRLTTEAETREEAEIRLGKAEAALRLRLGRYIFGSGEDFSVEAGVGQRLKQEHLMLAVAESCTGGMLTKRITDAPGSSQWFERGFVTYSNEAKHELLGVPYQLLDEYGAVSAEVAEAMAEGVLRRSRAQVALSITGIAGPSGGTQQKPVGLVYIGYADEKETLHRKYIFGSDRHNNRVRSVAAALVLLLEQIGLHPGDRPDSKE